MKCIRSLIFVFVIMAIATPKSEALSRTSKIFILTSTYGVVAGSLTGIASLAFYDAPKQHLRNVAMGASLGLYVGILLGAYMVYFVPDPSSKSKSSQPKMDPENPLNLPESNEENDDASSQLRMIDPPRLMPLMAYDPELKMGSIGLQYTF